MTVPNWQSPWGILEWLLYHTMHAVTENKVSRCDGESKCVHLDALVFVISSIFSALVPTYLALIEDTGDRALREEQNFNIHDDVTMAAPMEDNGGYLLVADHLINTSVFWYVQILLQFGLLIFLLTCIWIIIASMNGLEPPSHHLYIWWPIIKSVILQILEINYAANRTVIVRKELRSVRLQMPPHGTLSNTRMRTKVPSCKYLKSITQRMTELLFCIMSLKVCFYKCRRTWHWVIREYARKEKTFHIVECS